MSLIVEQGEVAEVYHRPRHACTRELIAAAPNLRTELVRLKGER